jgi:stage IV sporulation protein FB
VKFSLPGVPVTVHWSFLVVALFGIGRYTEPLDIAAWTLAVFGAVLLHELGHAYTATAYGATQVSVTIFALGGYTSWLPKPSIGPPKRFVISAAGSAVGIAVGLLVMWTLVPITLFGQTYGNDAGLTGPARAFFGTIVLVGLFWGVLNWIPLLPLDGGHMLNHALAIVWPKQAPSITLAVSTTVGVALIAVAFYFGDLFIAIFLMFIVMSGWRSRPQLETSQRTSQQPTDDPSPPVQRYQTPRPYPPADPTPRDEPEPPVFPI